jgi:hypothetical protein
MAAQLCCPLSFLAIPKYEIPLFVMTELMLTKLLYPQATETELILGAEHHDIMCMISVVHYDAVTLFPSLQPPLPFHFDTICRRSWSMHSPKKI